MKLAIRISCGAEVRVVIGESRSLTFEDITKRIYSYFPNLSPCFAVKYDDGFPGLVTISTEEEWTLITLATRVSPLQFYVFDRDDEDRNVPIELMEAQVDYDGLKPHFSTPEWEITTKDVSVDEIEAQIRKLEDQTWYETEERRKKAEGLNVEADSLRWESQILSTKASILLRGNEEMQERTRHIVEEARRIVRNKTASRILQQRQRKREEEEERLVEKKLEEGRSSWFQISEQEKKKLEDREKEIIDEIEKLHKCKEEENVQNLPENIMEEMYLQYIKLVNKNSTAHSLFGCHPDFVIEQEQEQEEQEEKEETEEEDSTERWDWFKDEYQHQVYQEDPFENDDEEDDLIFEVEESDEEEEEDEEYSFEGESSEEEDDEEEEEEYIIDEEENDELEYQEDYSTLTYSSYSYQVEEIEEEIHQIEEKSEEEEAEANEEVFESEFEPQVEDDKEERQLLDRLKQEIQYAQAQIEEDERNQEENEWNAVSSSPIDIVAPPLIRAASPDFSFPSTLPSFINPIVTPQEVISSSPPSPQEQRKESGESAPKKPFLFNFLSSIFDTKVSQKLRSLSDISIHNANPFTHNHEEKASNSNSFVEAKVGETDAISRENSFLSNHSEYESHSEHYESGNETMELSHEIVIENPLFDLADSNPRIEKKESIYFSSVQLLSEMGWKDEVKNDELLTKYQGDISEVIRELLEM